MTDIVDFEEFKSKKSQGQNNNTEEQTAPAPVERPMFSFTFLLKTGESITREGGLSVGPIFTAVVDKNDQIELVVASSEILWISKDPRVIDEETES